MKFGSRIYTATIIINGHIEPERCKELTEKIIKKIGMTKAHDGAIFNYPVNNKGDGYIYIQTIIESYIAWDVWYSLNGAYLTICSCKKFDANRVRDLFFGDIKIREIYAKNLEMK